MLNIAWFLWALKIAGLTSISYNNIGWLTLIFLVFKFLTIALKDFVFNKKAEDEINQLTEKKLTNNESIMAVLLLMYKKLK